MINTGDFVTLGRREFSGFVTILSKYKARYGNYAVWETMIWEHIFRQKLKKKKR
jgi:predicted MPP superfamily phosphohydrolase